MLTAFALVVKRNACLPSSACAKLAGAAVGVNELLLRAPLSMSSWWALAPNL
jgi:hypothetical protein